MRIKTVRRAIEIQGYITIYTDRGAEKVTAITGTDKDGAWVTNLMTRDLMGYIRIKKTKKDVIAQAERIIANEVEIRAKRAAHDREVADRMQWS